MGDTPNSYLSSRVKRLFDFSLSVPTAILTLPVLALLSIWSAASFRAWPILTQERVGRLGQTFTMLKLRTLPTTTPKDLDRASLNEWVRPGALAKAIRASHLDELPQLFNIIAGHMSLVGPRPMIPRIVNYLHPEFSRIRHTVRPGLTGLWQISECGSRQLDPVDPLDVAYVSHATFADDVRILTRTALQILGAPPLPTARLNGGHGVESDRFTQQADDTLAYEFAEVD